MGPDELRAEVERIGGFEPGTPRLARDPVNQPMIHNWVEAIGDRNPVYVDDAAARAAGFEGVVAPPAMTQSWTMPGPGADRADDHPTVRLFDLLEGAGFTSIVATNCDTVYHRYVGLGERLTLSTVLAELVGPKQTALGEGWFCTMHNTWKVDDEPVAEMKFRMLKFRPRASSPTSAGPAAGRPTPPRPDPADVAPRSGGTATLVATGARPLVVGTTFPTLDVRATPTFIVAAALATRDFQEVHHDRDIAVARGSQDIFANILTDAGLVQRYVSESIGYDARFLSTDLRLGVPWYAYDTLTLSGQVVGVEGPVVTVSVTGTDALGPHIVATARLRLPDDARS